MTSRRHVWTAWRNVSIVAGLGCGVIGVPNFVILTRYLPTVTDLRSGAAWFLGAYTVSVALVVGGIVVWLHRGGRSLDDIGWVRRTSRPAVISAIAWSGVWLSFSLFGASFELRGESRAMPIAEISATRLLFALDGVIISIGEEIINRGFIITELERAGVTSPWQIVASGGVFALYHSLGNLSVLSIVPSFIFGVVLAVLYVFGRRSLTPPILSHGLVNFLGEPILVMSLLASGYNR